MKDIINLLNEYGIMGTVQNVLLALIILFVGLFVIRKFLNVIDKQLSRKYEDPTLVGFIMSLTGWSLKILLFITVASTVGIQTTSFVAILGAAGLAIGLALQGTLGNFAGGVLVLLFKPFKVGDLIEANGELGVVKEVQIFNTIMTSPENKQLILPNGAIMNGNIKN